MYIQEQYIREQHIHEQKHWPRFYWNAEKLTELLASVRHRQGKLLGRMESLELNLRVLSASLRDEVRAL